MAQVDGGLSETTAYMLEQLIKRLPLYQLYLQYYEGRHRLAYATERYRTVFGLVFRTFADNLCAKVVRAHAARMEILGFKSELGEEVPDQVWELWARNRMGRISQIVHREALLSGDAYLIVWPTDDGVRFYPNRASEMSVLYNEDGEIEQAIKFWSDPVRKRRYLTVYTAESIMKYEAPFAQGAGESLSGVVRLSDFVPRIVEGEPWPLPVPDVGQVPVFHFPTDSDSGELGHSVLRDIIPLQDALNKAVMDLLIAMEYVSLPQRWVAGIEVDLGPNGEPIPPFTPGVERVWSVASPDVKFGQFEPADLSQFLGVQESLRREIARVAEIPSYYMLSEEREVPSGEAMKTAEEMFTSVIRSRQEFWGDIWEAVMELALRFMGERAPLLSAVWKDPVPRSEKVMAEVAVMKRELGISLVQILRELGYSPEEIEQIIKERAAESVSASDFEQKLLEEMIGEG